MEIFLYSFLAQVPKEIYKTIDLPIYHTVGLQITLDNPDKQIHIMK